MSKKTGKYFIIASALILCGIFLFCGIMCVLKWDFGKLSITEYETRTCDIKESFNNISIDVSTADVILLPAEDDSVSVVCHECKDEPNSVKVENETLLIESYGTRRWYKHVLDFENPSVKIYIPKGQYGTLTIDSTTARIEISKDFKFDNIDISNTTGEIFNYASVNGILDIKNTSGDITVENVTAGDVKLKVTTGDITVSGIDCIGDLKMSVSTGRVKFTDSLCKSFESSGTTGDIVIKNVKADGKLFIERTTGDVRFVACDASELGVKTGTGDVEGSLLTEKVFVVNTTTGDINVPQGSGGGICEIKTTTGDVDIEIVN